MDYKNITKLPDRHYEFIDRAVRTPAAPFEMGHNQFTTDLANAEIQEVEEMKRMRFTIVERCETTTGPIYRTRMKTDDEEQWKSKIHRRLIGYQLARELNLPIVPHATRDGWIATPEFTGDSNWAVVVKDDVFDTFLTDFAKQILICNWDFLVDFLVDGADRRHVDITPAFDDPVEIAFNICRELYRLYREQLRIGEEIIDIILHRAYDMGLYIERNFREVFTGEIFPSHYHEEYREILRKVTLNLPRLRDEYEDEIHRRSGAKLKLKKYDVAQGDTPWEAAIIKKDPPDR